MNFLRSLRENVYSTTLSQKFANRSRSAIIFSLHIQLHLGNFARATMTSDDDARGFAARDLGRDFTPISHQLNSFVGAERTCMRASELAS